MVDIFIYDSLMMNKTFRNKFFNRIVSVYNNETVMGYHKFRIDKGNLVSQCALKSVPEDGISGLIIQLSYGELEKLDKYQTTLYTRKQVESTSMKTVWMYVANDKTYKEKFDLKK